MADGPSIAAAQDILPTKQLCKNGRAKMPEDSCLLEPTQKLEPHHDHQIANLFSAAPETGELFPRVMESLLANSSDAGVKNKINKQLAEDDYYNPVKTTLQRWRQFKPDATTFNALIIEARKVGMNDMADRILELGKSVQQEASIISPLRATPPAACSRSFQVIPGGSRSTHTCAVELGCAADRNGNFNESDRGEPPNNNDEESDPFTTVSTGNVVQSSRASFFLRWKIICKRYPKIAISGGCVFGILLFAAAVGIVLWLSGLNTKSPRSRNANTTRNLSPRTNPPTGGLDITVDTARYENFEMPICRDAQSLTLVITDSQDSLLDIIAACDKTTTKLTISGNLTTVHLQQILQSNLRPSLEEINFSGNDVCNEFYLPDDYVCEFGNLDSLQSVQFNGMMAACADLYDFMWKCVKFVSEFQVSVLNCLIPDMRSATALYKLGVESGKQIFLGENVTGVLPYTGALRTDN